MSARLLFLLSLVMYGGVNAQLVTGVVIDTRSDTIAGAEVVLESEGILERTVTGNDGTFSFELPAGKLIVSASGFERQVVQLRRERSELLTIVLQPAPVTGNVNVSVTRSETQQNNTRSSIAVVTIERRSVTSSRTVDDTVRQV